jgi:hypothetical protein
LVAKKFKYEATDAKLKAQEVLEIARTVTDDRELENQLVLRLGYHQFDFIKTLTTHRQMSMFFFFKYSIKKFVFIFSSLPASSQSVSEKAEIEDKMRNKFEFSKLYQKLIEMIQYRLVFKKKIMLDQ